MRRRVALQLLLLVQITSLVVGGSDEDDSDVTETCPLNMKVLRKHFNKNENQEWEMVAKLTETLERISEENLQQSIQMSSLMQRVDQNFHKLETRIDRMEHKRDGQIASVQREVQKIAEPVLEKIDSKFTEVDQTLEKFKVNQSTFGDGMAEKIDTMMLTVQNLKRGLKEDMFKCGKALKLPLTTIAAGIFYFSPNISNWHLAKSFCEENDMQLAKIENEQQLRQVDLAAPNHNAWYWVSGSDVGHNPGDFYWSDGSSVANDLWDKDQPSSFGPGYATCIFLYTENAKLGDYRCMNKEFFVCQLGPECFHKDEV